MGLDSYIIATKYVNKTSNKTSPICNDYDKVVSALGLSSDDWVSDFPTITVKLDIAYWRKANAIHAWFVDNCQNGVDECQHSDVSREQLQELVDLCKKVIANPAKASSLLETRGGFFFGSTNYDDYFFDDIRNTVTMLEKVLQNPKFADWSFEYHASW